MRISLFIRAIYPEAIWNVKNSKNEIYITFDDGPDPEITPKVLDILKQFNAKATFFCVGENVKKYPEAFKQIIAGGHAVGNHTYNHLKGWRTNNKDYFENIEMAANYILSNLFRPPYGRLKISQYSKLCKKYKIIMWDVLSLDYSKNITKEKCAQKVIKNARPGSIVVFHDAKKMQENMFYALPKVLEHFKNKGFVMNSLILL